MAVIIFEEKIDMLSVTPPVEGFLIGYDLDGILKQKDEFGVVTPVGFSTSLSLEQVLNIGNNSGDNHIILGTATSITSENGGAFLLLDEGLNPGWIRLQSSLGDLSINSLNSGLDVNSNLRIKNGDNYYQSLINGTQSLSSVKGIEIGINSNDEINISENILSSSFTKSVVKRPLMLSTFGSEVAPGVINSVVVGGVNILATQSNTVYLGNNVNINNAYTLPNSSGQNGQFLKFGNDGITTWSFIENELTPSLDSVLSMGNKTGTYSIIMGTQSSIKAEYGNGSLFFTHLPTSVAISTDNGQMNTSYLIVRDSDVFLKAVDNLSITASSAFVSTSDNHGLRYTSNYNFLDLSLITKSYVDTGTASIWQELDKKTEKQVFVVNLLADVYLNINHTLNSTDLSIEFIYELEFIQIDSIEILNSSNIKIRSTRNLNNLKVIING